MAATNPQTAPLSIWAQMSYMPPRGPCSQRATMMTTCPCYRFMVHPLKASSSFDCDGCGHHASFHRMENKEEEEATRRWKAAQDEERRLEIVRNDRGEASGNQRLLTLEGEFLMESLSEQREEREERQKRRRMDEAHSVIDLEEASVARTAVVGKKRKGRNER